MTTDQIAAEAWAEILDLPMKSGRGQKAIAIIKSAIEKATNACTCLPMNERDCPVHPRADRIRKLIDVFTQRAAQRTRANRRNEL